MHLRAVGQKVDRSLDVAGGDGAAALEAEEWSIGHLAGACGWSCFMGHVAGAEAET